MANPPVELKIKGIRQLEAGARQLFEKIEQAEARDAIQPTTEQVAAQVRARVPKKSGALAASVHAEMRGNVGQVTMGAGLPYATFIEFGAWGGRKKGPRYVYPTAKRTVRAFRKHAELVCAQQIRSQHWQTPH